MKNSSERVEKKIKVLQSSSKVAPEENLDEWKLKKNVSSV